MSSRFEVLATPIAGLHLLQRKPIADRRGYFERLFCQAELSELLSGKTIAQINHTATERAGTVRGMHYQCPPFSEIKIVSCLRGEVFDVAIDLRRHSPTYLTWYGETLTASNHKTMVIPEGFAHGFQALTDDCEMLYFHTAPYQSGAEAGLNARDARLGIAWPIVISEISPRDSTFPMLTNTFAGVVP